MYWPAAGIPRRVLAIGMLAAGALLGALPASAGAFTQTFSATGEHQFVVPADVTQISVDAFGAKGGGNAWGNTATGGLGAGALATTVAVTPGETLTVLVGGRGGDGTGACHQGTGGFNGGGTGGDCWSGMFGGGGGGGGASEVRRGTTSLVVAGGGGGGCGGGPYWQPCLGGEGGASGTHGDNGRGWVGEPGGYGGTGATPTSGGRGGIGIWCRTISYGCTTNNGADGWAGQGGSGGSGYSGSSAGSGGGGGGVFGGGGGGGGLGGGYDPGAGGGGSSAGPAGATFTPGADAANSGDGKVVISYVKPVLTVKVAPASMIYGDAVPTPLVEYTGFVHGDTGADLGGALTAVTDATDRSGVGEYVFSAGGLSSDEYEIEYVPATLTVEPRPLGAVADSVTRGYGEDNPELTGVLTGAVVGDAVAAEYTTTATKTSPLGIYPITAKVTGTEAVLANYAVTETPGVLTVEDRSAPRLVLPGGITVAATSTAGAVVDYTATATDEELGSLTADCTPASGSQFPIGTTAVDCTATDGIHTSPGSFDIEVTKPTPAQLANVVTTEATGSPAYLQLTTRQRQGADATIGTAAALIVRITSRPASGNSQAITAAQQSIQRLVKAGYLTAADGDRLTGLLGLLD
jgi:hypothetical protein